MPPKSLDLENAIRDIVASTSQGMRVPSARALAEQLSTGRTAVNHIITRLVGEGSLVQVGRKLIVGSAPRQKQSHIVLIGAEDETIRVAAEALSASGAAPSVRIAPDENTRRMLLLEMNHASKLPDGLLVFGPGCEDLLVGLDSRGVAVVICGSEVDGLSFVAADRSHLTAQAVMRLASLGHREIALILRMRQSSPFRQQLIDGYAVATRSHKLHHSAERVVVSWGKRELQKSLCTYFKPKNRVTAVISWDLEGALIALEEARKAGRRVPEDLSVVALLETPRAVTGSPPLTTLDVDHRGIARLAAAVLRDELQQLSKVTGVRRHHAIFCRPIWSLRSSLGPIANRDGKAIVPLNRSRRWPDNTQERLNLVEMENARQFPKIGKTRPRFQVVHLGPHLNRAFAPRSAWLGGDPLRNFQAGEQSIHGVPFLVGSSPDPRLPAAIVLRSAKAMRSAGKLLPDSITIPIAEAGKDWRALHILHASGWNSRHEKIATYKLRSRAKTLASREVFALGEVTDSEQLDCLASISMVQDWHPSAQPFASQDVLPHIITEEGDPLRYERYIYHVRIINSSKGFPLEFFTMTAESPEARATLALLGLTLEY